MFFYNIVKLISFNVFSSFFNFISTLIIVNYFGLKIFGEFNIIISYINLFLLFIMLFPPNFAIIKIQDNKSFINLYVYTYFFMIFILSIIFLFFYYFNNLNYNFFYFYFFIISIILFRFIDIMSQSFNILEFYFKMLFLTSFSRLLILIYLKYFEKDFLKDINTLILIQDISAIIGISFYIYLLYNYKNINLANLFKKLKSILKMYKLYNIYDYIKKNKNIFKDYYFNFFLKNFKENIFIIIISFFYNKETIGLISLFIKISAFVLGQIRIIEAYFLNKINLIYFESFKNNKFIISIISQIIFIIVGIFYLKFTVNNIYLNYLIIFSFITYIYIYIIELRNKFLHLYKIKYINNGIIISIVSFLTFFFILKNLLTAIISVIISLLVSETFNAIYLKIKLKGLDNAN